MKIDNFLDDEGKTEVVEEVVEEEEVEAESVADQVKNYKEEVEKFGRLGNWGGIWKEEVIKLYTLKSKQPERFYFLSNYNFSRLVDYFAPTTILEVNTPTARTELSVPITFKILEERVSVELRKVVKRQEDVVGRFKIWEGEEERYDLIHINLPLPFWRDEGTQLRFKSLGEYEKYCNELLTASAALLNKNGRMSVLVRDVSAVNGMMLQGRIIPIATLLHPNLKLVSMIVLDVEPDKSLAFFMKDHASKRFATYQYYLLIYSSE